MRHAINISDGHLGVRESEDVTNALDAQAHLIQNLADECKGDIEVTINGDLIAGPYQRGDADDPRAYRYPKNWEDILIAQAPYLFDLLRERQIPVTYTLGNSERREDTRPDVLERRFGPAINWTQNTGKHAVYDSQRKLLMTHLDLAEPPLRMLKSSAPLELIASVSRRIANILYARQDRSAAWERHLERVTQNLSMAATAGTEGELFLDQTAIDIDEKHRASCLENEGMDTVLKYLPGALWAKNGLIFRTLERVYRRTLAGAGPLPVETEIMSGGHTHMPYIYSRDQLVQELGIVPAENLRYIVNSGTMVPLTADHGGDHRAHLLHFAGREPRLWQTYDAKRPNRKPILVNVAGQRFF
jgi:hypothetical protein